MSEDERLAACLAYASGFLIGLLLIAESIMNKKSPILGLLTMAIIFGAGADVLAQRNKKKNDLTTIKGRIVQNEDPNLRLPFNDLNIRLLEQVRLPVPKIPQGFGDLNFEERKKWLEDFEASPEGKKLKEERQKAHESAQSFDIKVEKNGKFIVYDVPPGRYGMRGRADKKIENKLYAFEIVGQIDVQEEVDELDLGRMKISTTRLLRRGELMPEIELDSFGEKKITNLQLKDKYVVVYFWSMENPPSKEFLDIVQLMQNQIAGRPNFEVLSVNLDDDIEAAQKHVKDILMQGLHGFAGDWEHKTVTEFGVRAIPALYLLGDDGNILMTNVEFLQALGAGKDDLMQIVDDRIAGRDLPDNKTPTEKK